MKQIINGKTYNTETATRLCDVSASGCNSSDFEWWSETPSIKRQKARISCMVKAAD